MLTLLVTSGDAPNNYYSFQNSWSLFISHAFSLMLTQTDSFVAVGSSLQFPPREKHTSLMSVIFCSNHQGKSACVSFQTQTLKQLQILKSRLHLPPPLPGCFIIEKGP